LWEAKKRHKNLDDHPSNELKQAKAKNQSASKTFSDAKQKAQSTGGGAKEGNNSLRTILTTWEVPGRKFITTESLDEKF